VYGLALSYLKNGAEAEDVAQDTFVKVWAAAPSYRPQGKPMAWLLTIARNLALGRLRTAARIQDLSMNAQKLAGQCAKLKCCLNYEVENYVEALKEFPSREIELKTKDLSYRFVKLDVFARKMVYAPVSQDSREKDMLELPLDRVKEIISMNERGEFPETPGVGDDKPKVPVINFESAAGEDSITRFDKNKKRNKKQRKRPDDNPNGGKNRPAQDKKTAGSEPSRPDETGKREEPRMQSDDKTRNRRNFHGRNNRRRNFRPDGRPQNNTNDNAQ